MDTDLPAVVTCKIAVFRSLANKRSSNLNPVDVRINAFRRSVVTDASSNLADSVLRRFKRLTNPAFPIGCPVANLDVLEDLPGEGNKLVSNVHGVDVDVNKVFSGDLVR
jgi:hypothetical protein